MCYEKCLTYNKISINASNEIVKKGIVELINITSGMTLSLNSEFRLCCFIEGSTFHSLCDMETHYLPFLYLSFLICNVELI